MKKTHNLKPIRKNKNTEIIFTFKVFGDKLYLDMREKVISDEYTGFTKKGICFDVDLIPEFIENLQQAQEYLNKTKPEKDLIEVMKLLEKEEEINTTKAEKLIKFCYKNEYFKEAVALFKLVNDETIDKEKLKEIKKIVDVCRMKIE